MTKNNQFMTLSKQDHDFNSYLTGEFSSHQRAIPIHSFSVNTPSEKVTFELREVSKIKKPNILTLLLSLSRPLFWVFTLGPLMISMALNHALGMSLNYLNFALSFVCLILLNLSAFSLNDYYDHLAGVDRISRTSGSQVIQQAWLSAFQVKKIAFICLLLSFLIAIPLIVVEPKLVLSLAVFVGFALFAFSYKDFGLKYKGLGEFVVFMALGPLIMLGLSTVISSEFRWEHLAVGACLGWMAMIHMQMKNWMHIMADSQAGIKTFISRLGFDKAKMYLCFQLMILFLLSLGVLYLPISQIAALGFSSFVGLSCVFLCFKILNINSPVSSQLKKIYLYTMNLNWLYCVLFAGVLIFAS